MSGLADIEKIALAAVEGALKAIDPSSGAAHPTPSVIVTVGSTNITTDEFGQGLETLKAIWAAIQAKGGNVNADMIAAEDVATIIAELDPPLAPAITVGKFLLPLLVAGYQSGGIKGEAPGPSFENSPNFRDR